MATKRKSKLKMIKSADALKEIRDYDSLETTGIIDPTLPLTLESLGLKLPELPPTQVISIRLPSELLNELRAMGSELDVPYQALIKLYLRKAINSEKRKRRVA